MTSEDKCKVWCAFALALAVVGLFFSISLRDSTDESGNISACARYCETGNMVSYGTCVCRQPGD